MTSVLFIWVLAQGVLAPPTTETFYTLEACQAAARKAENSLVLFEGQRPDARTVHRNELVRINDG